MDEKLEFKINQFEGPLDLLLHLIDKNKFNIFDIPIVEITEQYLDYLNRMQEENLDVMSEFLVMAATLISIKAKMLLPREEKEEEKSGEKYILHYSDSNKTMEATISGKQMTIVISGSDSMRLVFETK